MKIVFQCRSFRFAPMILALIMALSCAKKREPVPEQSIVARIGDRIIREAEFIQRAEYTIRPGYCKHDNVIHKKIILNSLIAEKLLALEAGDTNALALNENFRLFIRGQKEQLMRQLFLKERIYRRIELDGQDIKRTFELAGRSYRVEYIAVAGEPASARVQKALFEDGLSFAELFEYHSAADSIPEREISWHSAGSGAVRQALYENDVEVGQVLGPVDAEGVNLFLHVLGWTERPALSSQDIQNRMDDVREHFRSKRAFEIYSAYIRELMDGVEVRFDRRAMEKLVNLLAPIYFDPQRRAESEFRRRIYHRDSEDGIQIDSLGAEFRRIEDVPLLTFGDETWTVGDLQKQIALHPLQFRARKIAKPDFAQQVKLAIVDLIADDAITRQAYRDGYDSSPIVETRARMWRDAYVAAFYRDSWLRRRGELERFKASPLPVIESSLNALVDSLQLKYAGRIEINTDLLEQIVLSRIDMFVIYESQPFRVVVPPFPTLTTDHALDYGRRLIAQ